MTVNKNMLPENVAKEFQMGIHEASVITLPSRWGGETIDFTNISIEKARQLAALKDGETSFPYLVKPTASVGLKTP